MRIVVDIEDQLAVLRVSLAAEPPPAVALAHHPEFTRATLHHGELVTLAEAAKRLSRPESTLRNWLSDRRFRVHGHLGRAALVGWGDVVEAEYSTRRPKPRLTQGA